MRLVPGQMGSILADHADRTDPGDSRSRPRARREHAFDAMMQMKKIDIAVIEAARPRLRLQSANALDGSASHRLVLLVECSLARRVTRQRLSSVVQKEAAIMRAIADALVYAVSYINCRPLEEHESRYDDGDVGALESIAGFLADATDEEQDALAAAADRALSVEMALRPPRNEFVQDYSRWMEDMFGEGWQGNASVCRASDEPQNTHHSRAAPHGRAQWLFARDRDAGGTAQRHRSGGPWGNVRSDPRWSQHDARRSFRHSASRRRSVPDGRAIAYSYNPIVSRSGFIFVGGPLWSLRLLSLRAPHERKPLACLQSRRQAQVVHVLSREERRRLAGVLRRGIVASMTMAALGSMTMRSLSPFPPRTMICA